MVGLALQEPLNRKGIGGLREPGGAKTSQKPREGKRRQKEPGASWSQEEEGKQGEARRSNKPGEPSICYAGVCCKLVKLATLCSGAWATWVQMAT